MMRHPVPAPTPLLACMAEPACGRVTLARVASNSCMAGIEPWNLP